MLNLQDSIMKYEKFGMFEIFVTFSFVWDWNTVHSSIICTYRRIAVRVVCAVTMILAYTVYDGIIVGWRDKWDGYVTSMRLWNIFVSLGWSNIHVVTLLTYGFTIYQCWHRII